MCKVHWDLKAIEYTGHSADIHNMCMYSVHVYSTLHVWMNVCMCACLCTSTGRAVPSGVTLRILRR